MRGWLLFASMLGCSTDTFVDNDASADAASDVIVACPLTGDPGSPCSNAVCDTPNACCVPFDTAPSCIAAASCTSDAFSCLREADCAGQACCLHAPLDTTRCPHAITSSSGAKTTCMLGSVCDNTGGLRVCTNDSDCTAPATCHNATLYGSVVSIGVCLR